MRHFISVFLMLTGAWLAAQNCCSIVIPPVTLTGNKTAIEKQIIGEQNEIEKDVWMVSSAKTTMNTDIDLKRGDEKDYKQKSNSYAYEALYLMSVFQPKLEKLKEEKVVGENNKGYLSILVNDGGVSVPAAARAKYNPEYEKDPDKGRDYRILLNTVNQVNRARKLLAKGFIEEQKQKNPKFKADVNALVSQQKRKYHENTLKGGYVQADDGRWLIK